MVQIRVFMMILRFRASGLGFNVRPSGLVLGGFQEWWLFFQGLGFRVR